MVCFLLSRRTSAATTHAVLSDDEEDELLSGDSLWEDDREAAKVCSNPICRSSSLVMMHAHYFT